MSRHSGILVVLILFILIWDTTGYNPFKNETARDYSASVQDLKELIRLEQKLLPVLIEYKESLDRKLGLLNRYLAESERSIPGLFEAQMLDKAREALMEKSVKSPITSYMLIRRLANLLPLIELEVTERPEREFLAKLAEAKSGLPFPTEEDLGSSGIAVLRLVETYRIPFHELEQGIIEGDPDSPGRGLEAPHFDEIGDLAFRFEHLSLAIEFWNKALELRERELNTGAQGPSLAEIEAKLYDAIRMHDEHLESGVFNPNSSLFHYVQPLYSRSHVNFKTRVEAEPKLNIFQVENRGTVTHAFQKLCRGEKFDPPGKKMADLNCFFLSPHPALILTPLRAELHNANPPILQLYDVLSEPQMERIRKEAALDLSPSRILGSTKVFLSKTSLFRTSTNTWILDHEPGNPFEFINKRIEQITGLKLIGDLDRAAETVQIANYGAGAHYITHYDAVHEPEILNTLEPYEFERGDRISTFMFYLSDVESGGATAFPHLGVSVRPVKGSGLWWFNLHTDLSINRKTLHGGCPVLYGNKWVANKWIRAYDQMFIRKCPKVQSQDVWL